VLQVLQEHVPATCWSFKDIMLFKIYKALTLGAGVDDCKAHQDAQDDAGCLQIVTCFVTDTFAVFWNASVKPATAAAAGLAYSQVASFIQTKSQLYCATDMRWRMCCSI
jgi:hypothetical protein